jgi:hypothetical protein
VWVPSPSILVAAVAGFGEAEFVAPIMMPFKSLPKTSPVHVFFDVESMTSYDSALRSGLTEGLRADRAGIAAVYVLVHTRIVAMGVSVASLALGGLLTSLTDRDAFTAKLDACLSEHRVVGFSSNALDALRVAQASAG